MEEVTLVTLVKDGCYTTKRSDSSRLKEYLTHGWEIVEPVQETVQEPEPPDVLIEDEPEIWPDLDDFEPEPIPEPVAKGRGK